MVWLTAFNLRAVIMAVPPVLPAMSADLKLSFTATGAVPSLTLLSIGLAAVPGALITSRLGAHRLVWMGLLVMAASAFVRLLPPELFWLYTGTALLGSAIGAIQPAVAQLLRAWFPNAIGPAASLYANGLLAGGVVASSITPFLLGFGGWRPTFVIWAAFALLVALLWKRVTPTGLETVAARGGLRRLARQPEVWLSAGLFACCNVAFFTTLAWLPFLLKGSSAYYVALVLFIFNASSLPPSLLLAAVHWNYVTSPAFYIVAGLLTGLGTAGLLLGLNDLAWALCLVAGAGVASIFVGSMAAPSVLSRSQDDVPAFSALVIIVGYVPSFLGPLLGGALVDLTHRITTAFWPAMAACLISALIGWRLTRLKPQDLA